MADLDAGQFEGGPRRSGRLVLKINVPHPKLTPSERMKLYRERLKADPAFYESYKEKERLRKKIARQTSRSITLEKKIEQRMQWKEASKRYRLKKRLFTEQTPAKTSPTTPLRTKTRAEEKRLAERREKNKLSQQKRRQNMSVQKKRRENEKALERYYRRKATKFVDSSTETDPPAAASTPTWPPSKTARRSASYRLRVKLGGGVPDKELTALVRSEFKKRPDDLKTLGVHYHSPAKSLPQCKCDTLFKNVLEYIKKKRTSETLKAKRFMLKIVSGIKDKARMFRNTLSRMDKKRRPLKPNKKKIKVMKFFNDVSIFLPNKSAVGKDLQSKKILPTNMRVLYNRFMAESGMIISFATFCRYRPKNVLSFTKHQLRQCMCEKCLNPLYKLRVMNKFINANEKVNTLSELLKSSMCAHEGEYAKPDCIARKCKECGHIKFNKLFDMSISTLQISVEWKRWEFVKKNNQGQNKMSDKGANRLELVLKSGTLQMLIQELWEEVSLLSQHDFNNHWQAKQFQKLLATLPINWAVTVMDFAENYLCVQQDQPQSAYYSYNQVTLHPTVTYTICDSCEQTITINRVFISDDLKHDAQFVNAVKVTLEEEDWNGIEKIVVFSDNCANQYKSKLPFYFLSKGNNNIEWHYFGARHGKNPCDALGGVIKTVVLNAVKSRQVVVQNAKDFYKFCNQNLVIKHGPCVHQIRTFHLVPRVERKNYNSLKTIPGTRKLHAVRPVAEGILEIRNASCFCKNCRMSQYEKCLQKQYVNSWDVIKLTQSHSNTSPQTNSAKPIGKGQSVKAQLRKEKIQCLFPIPLERNAFFEKCDSELLQCATYSYLKTKCELLSKDLKSYPIFFDKEKTVTSLGARIDAIAKEFVPSDLPYFPVVVVGDGNCVPRSLSMAVFGNEDHHREIRVRIVIELVLNEDLFLNESHWQMSKDVMQNIADSSEYRCSSLKATFRQETMAVVKSGTYMGLWQLMAASRCLSCSIDSIYPSKGWPVHHQMCNRTICPIGVDNKNLNIRLLWSSTRTDSNSDEHWVANHVTPLFRMSEPLEISVDSVCVEHVSTNVDLESSDFLNDFSHYPGLSDDLVISETSVMSDCNKSPLNVTSEVPLVGGFYEVLWNNDKYIAQVESVDMMEKVMLVNFMQSKKGLFFWPEVKDSSWESFKTIVRKITLELDESRSNQRIQYYSCLSMDQKSSQI